MGKKNKVYVCCHGEDKKGRCGFNGSKLIRRELKHAVKNLGIEVSVKKSGCLGACSKKVAIQINKEKPVKISGTEDILSLLKQRAF